VPVEVFSDRFAVEFYRVYVYERRSRDRNFQCCQSATSILDATLLLYAVFIDLNRFWLSFLYVFVFLYIFNCQLVFSYARSIVCFTFCTVAIGLLTALYSAAYVLVTCFSINTHYI